MSSVPELEQQTVQIDVDEHHKEKVDALIAQGWEMVPGTKPVTTYHLVRVKRPAPGPTDGFALGIMQINDDLVQVIPAKKN